MVRSFAYYSNRWDIMWYLRNVTGVRCSPSTPLTIIMQVWGYLESRRQLKHVSNTSTILTVWSRQKRLYHKGWAGR
jgi:hypothetical protein